eukprot:GILJ01002832.1.p1 GENE.GILJ01002832.1~~GILJ01002832.1.p1  ORF type:complete len:447 (+),score=31.05 GILJ01002832.1:50-1390(+)
MASSPRPVPPRPRTGGSSARRTTESSFSHRKIVRPHTSFDFHLDLDAVYKANEEPYHQSPRAITPQQSFLSPKRSGRASAPPTDRQSSDFPPRPRSTASPTPRARSALSRFSLRSTLAEENLRAASPRLPTPRDIPTPRVNEPQRIELPPFFNTPRRSAVSSSANVSYKQVADENDDKFSGRSRMLSLKRVKDYGMLAFACRRGGRVRDEGRAYYSMGVLYDNLGMFKHAVTCYERFLHICEKMEDFNGVALAFNCIGVNYQALGDKTGDMECYQKAVYNHSQHKDIADIPGKFIAHLNMGLAYLRLGEREKASVNHQFALRYSIQMSSLTGQSLAIGNLGLTGSLEGDLERARTFMQRYLQLSNTLGDRSGQSGAYQHLGVLTNAMGNYDESSQHFYNAMQLYNQTGDQVSASRAKCNFGIAYGNMKMEEHMKSLLQMPSDTQKS